MSAGSINRILSAAVLGVFAKYSMKPVVPSGRWLTKAPIDGDSGSAASGREVIDQATLRRRSCFYLG